MIVTKGMYDKEFKFDNNGKEESIIIKPLPSEHLKKLFSILKSVDTKDVKELQILTSDSEDIKTLKQQKLGQLFAERLLEDEILQSLLDIVSVTVKKSYPQLDEELRDEFVTNNIFTLLPFIIEVNIKKR